jgi:isocitrate/isopropylmalate dehydrogenase
MTELVRKNCATVELKMYLVQPVAPRMDTHLQTLDFGVVPNLFGDILPDIARAILVASESRSGRTSIRGDARIDL